MPERARAPKVTTTLPVLFAFGAIAGSASCVPEIPSSNGDLGGAGGNAAMGGSFPPAGTSGLGGRAGSEGSGPAGNASGGSAASGASTGTSGAGANAGEGSPGGADNLGGTSSEVMAGASGKSDSGGAAGAGTTPLVAISARDAAAAMGRGFNLGQMFENTQHPRTLAAASAKIDAYYAKGFRNVRIPITWTEVVDGDRLVSDPATGEVDRAHPRLAVIEQVVDHALSKPDMYVVLNAHHEDALKTQSRASVLVRLWSDLADIFRERAHRLLFEFLNEPHRDDGSAMPAADLRSMTASAYAKVRAVDRERIVLIGGNRWFGAAEMAQVWTNLDGVGGGQDPYVMATFHHYDPWSFCGDNQGTYDDAWTDENMSAPMETMLSWAKSVGEGMPVYIGEWGVGWGSRYGVLECNNVRHWYQKLHSEFAAPRGIPTAVWDDGGWFKIYDHATDSYANNLADCITGTCEWDGTERFNDGCE